MSHMQLNSKPTATESLFCKAMKRFACICAAGTLLLTAIAPLVAAPKPYQWTNLVSDIAGVALTNSAISRKRRQVKCPTAPVPLVGQGSTKVKLATVAHEWPKRFGRTHFTPGQHRSSVHRAANWTDSHLARDGAILLQLPSSMSRAGLFH